MVAGSRSLAIRDDLRGDGAHNRVHWGLRIVDAGTGSRAERGGGNIRVARRRRSAAAGGVGWGGERPVVW
jgi:hypothetical protein